MRTFTRHPFSQTKLLETKTNGRTHNSSIFYPKGGRLHRDPHKGFEIREVIQIAVI